MSSAKHFLFCGPSGSGKTSIVHYLLQQFSQRLVFSVSATTRPKRNNETDGKDYHFITVDEFRKKIECDQFLEWEQVYEGHYYGTLKSEVEKAELRHKSVIFDVDVVGGLAIKKYFAGNLLAVMILPPSVEDLHKRLTMRNTETEESLKKRIDKAEFEMTFEKNFEHVIVNHDLEKSCEEAKKLVEEFLKK